jgi:hypothetical protein
MNTIIRNLGRQFGSSRQANTLTTGIFAALLATALTLLSGCGAGSSDTPSSTPSSSDIQVSTLSIATDKTTLKSDGTEYASITVTALSHGNIIAPGVPVQFSANDGSLSASTITTDANGIAKVTINSGNINQGNRTITVSATANGIGSPVMVPIQIAGSSISLTSTNSALVAGGTTTTLSATARNAGNVGVYNTLVSFSVSPSGSLAITPASGYTDSSGRISVAIAGITSGTSTVTATALGTQATTSYSVSASGSEFKITSPIDNPSPLTAITGSIQFDVQVGLSGATNIRFSSTLGSWTGCSTGNGTSVCTVPASLHVATLTSNTAGLATIQADGLDANGAVVATDAHSVAITSAASTAASIIVQSNVSVVPPSSGNTSNSASITGSVRDSQGQPVGNVPVVFTLENPTGGGESLSPVLAMTSDGSANNLLLPGQVKTTFTSGALPSGANGIGIKASIVGTNISDTAYVNVGGTAGSIFIGMASKITAPDILTYALPMSVLVADSNGNPVSGAVVSLSVWPAYYTTGGYYRITPIIAGNPGTKYCAIDKLGVYPALNTIEGGPDASFDNEDTNENLILDAGEDLNADGMLTPPNASAGLVPPPVTTDNSGIAKFDLTYLKQSAMWIGVRVRARAFVQGTESTSSFTFTLPAEVTDVQTCSLPDSPFLAPPP